MNLHDTIIQLLLSNKILLLFLVIALGYLIGKVKVFGFSFGVAAVLFVGLAFGAMHPDMALPDMIYMVGLVLFVYTIGLRSGASFFASFKKSGIRDNLLVISVLILSAGLTLGLGQLFSIKSTLLSGLFCGSLTNTPALASVIDVLKQTKTALPDEQLRKLMAEPVVGYSLSYPVGVMGVILLFQLGMRIWKVDLKKEAAATAEFTGISTEALDHINVEITNPALDGKNLQELAIFANFQDLTVSRHLPKGKTKVEVPSGQTIIRQGDVMTIVGPESQLEQAQAILGILSKKDLSLDAGELGMRRIFVSRREVIGKPIRELELHKKFRAVITRIRRGDVDLPFSAEMQLEAGDRVRVIAPKEKIQEISKYMGDSYQRLSEVDYISFSIGIALGLLLGMIPIPLPGGTTFKLGFAAGPLIVALWLGKLGRSGNFIWIMSYNANFTLRQIGAVLFLAGIGLKAGYSFFSTFQTAGFQMIALGAVVTIFTAGITMLVARLVFKMPFSLLMGMLSALHTQPACLAFANEKDDTGAANISYATVFPTAMVVKILLAQVILMLGGS